jgi:hypothetical protein
MRNKKVILGGVVVLVVGTIFVVMFVKVFSPTLPEKNLDLPERNDTATQVPIMFDYHTKIVYTTDTTVNKDIYAGDCSTRHGVFNYCGNTCAPSAETCVSVCALTCEVK